MFRRPRREECTIGWICALPVELAAALEMMDDDPGPPERYDNDENLYYLGQIAGHNIVIVCLPAGRIGNNPAAVVATQTRATFTGIQFGLMVGIGGGVPSPDIDIRLGDVVVSQPYKTFGGVVQYDFGKEDLSGFERTGALQAPPQILLAAIASLQANNFRGKSGISQHIRRLNARFQRGWAGPDILFNAAYDHNGGQTCDNCDIGNKQLRLPRSLDINNENADQVVVHYGTIASGNKVIKNAVQRDAISRHLEGVLCFEMEAAGLMNSFPCLVIRGICDYADSHKNKSWQPYAAAAAAAYTKELLLTIPSLGTVGRHAEHVSGDPSSSRLDPDQQHQSYTANEFGQSIYPYKPRGSRKETITTVYLDSSTGKQTIKQISLKITNDQRKRLMDSLDFVHRDARLRDLRVAQIKTCQWMLTNLYYREWNADNPRSNLFWIKGKPGAGKSIMMKFLVSEAKKIISKCHVLSFFFNYRGDSLERSTSGLYRSLLLQLLGQAPETWIAFNNYDQSMLNTIERSGWNTQTLKELFAQCIQEVELWRVICYIDALDECPEEEVRDMISFFKELEKLEKRVELRMCFSSRHYPEISIQSGFELSLESQQEHKRDIILYVDTHLKLGNSTQAEDIKAEILRKSSGIFLWVHLAVDILNKEYDRGRTGALIKRLSEIPEGLHNLFLDILHRDHVDENYFLVTIQVILFAARPLRPDEFRVAVESICDETYEIGPCDRRLMTPNNLRKFVLDASKGLAEITKSGEPTVQFIHESVRDYFFNEGSFDELRTNFTNPCGAGHDTLKTMCSLQLSYFGSNRRNIHAMYLRYLDVVREDSAMDEPFPRGELFEYLPLLHYAEKYIFYHAIGAQRFDLDQKTFLDNLDVHAWARGCILCNKLDSGLGFELLDRLGDYGAIDLVRAQSSSNRHHDRRDWSDFSLLAALLAGHIHTARTLVDLPQLSYKDPFGRSIHVDAVQRIARRSDIPGDQRLDRHLLSYLCHYGDKDILRSVLNAKLFTINRFIARQCSENASSSAIVDILSEFGLYMRSSTSITDVLEHRPFSTPKSSTGTDVDTLKRVLRRKKKFQNDT